MHSNSTTPHAAHDELLLARLYGGDVDERDRARALDPAGDSAAEVVNARRAAAALLAHHEPQCLTVLVTQRRRARVVRA